MKLIFTLAIALLSPQASPHMPDMPEPVRFAIEGRKLLAQHEAGFDLKEVCPKQKSNSKKSGARCHKVLGQFDVALAIKRGNEPFKIVEADGRSCVSKSRGFSLTCYTRNGKTNGVNTEFVVNEPSGYQVYALRRVIGAPKQYKEVVYTPYNEFLNTASVRQFGKAYLDKVVLGAYQDLHQHGVRSLANKGAFVHDRVPRQLIERLILVEHIDHGRFFNEPTIDLMKEVYTILALNQGLAYNYAKSTAAARGLLQVIPPTYAGLKRVYPSAALAPDFVSGMTNHHNAVKAAILLADHDVGVIPDVSTRAFLLDGKNLAKRQDYTCSAYNGGPARAMSILMKEKDHVRDNHNAENRTYVAKCRAVAQVAASVVVARF